MAPRPIVMRMDTQEKRHEVTNRMSLGQGSDEGAEDSKANGELAIAGGALASSAVLAEGIQIAGTAVLGELWTGTESPVEAVAALIDYLQQLPGLEGYAVFGSMMIFLQVVPIAAAFILTVSAGAIFGAVKGTAAVLTCSTISARIAGRFPFKELTVTTV